MLTDPNYTPCRLLDALMLQKGLKNDAALSRELGVAPPVISKIRHRKTAIGSTTLIYMHEAFDVSIADLKALAGIARAVAVPAEC